jgi:hypothetical protein
VSEVRRGGSAELESVGDDNVRSFEALQAGMQDLS